MHWNLKEEVLKLNTTLLEWHIMPFQSQAIVGDTPYGIVSQAEHLGWFITMCHLFNMRIIAQRHSAPLWVFPKTEMCMTSVVFVKLSCRQS